MFLKLCSIPFQKQQKERYETVSTCTQQNSASQNTPNNPQVELDNDEIIEDNQPEARYMTARNREYIKSWTRGGQFHDYG